MALTWVLPDTDQNVAYSARVADAGISGSDELVAPRLLTAECSYCLLKYGHQRRWGEAKIAEFAETIDLFNLRYFESSSPIASVVASLCATTCRAMTLRTLESRCLWVSRWRRLTADCVRRPRRRASRWRRDRPSNRLVFRSARRHTLLQQESPVDLLGGQIEVALRNTFLREVRAPACHHARHLTDHRLRSGERQRNERCSESAFCKVASAVTPDPHLLIAERPPPNPFARRHFRTETNGFSTFTPNCLKSATLRVTTTSLWTFAVAAIIASS